MSITDHAIAYAMKQYGGKFIQALGEAWFRADEENKAKIKATWSDEWLTYTGFALRDKQEDER